MTLGRLERVTLREVWQHEATDFTPWLAQEENLLLLGETLGLDLSMETTEHPVGPYSADIVCKDGATDNYVVIENQLERTDHSHLGQILTYAAGLGAKIVVWVAAKFTPEHKAALDFLNEHTEDDMGFFGVEVELYRIGESAIAPNFKVVCQPNDWSRNIRNEARNACGASPLRRLQVDFWHKLVEKASTAPGGFRPSIARPSTWNNFSLGKSGVHGVCRVNSQERHLWVEVYIDHGNSSVIFSRLLERRDEIQATLGMELDWREQPDRQTCRILSPMRPFDIRNNEEWEPSLDWLIETATLFNTVWRPILRQTDFEQ